LHVLQSPSFSVFAFWSPLTISGPYEACHNQLLMLQHIFLYLDAIKLFVKTYHHFIAVSSQIFEGKKFVNETSL